MGIKRGGRRGERKEEGEEERGKRREKRREERGGRRGERKEEGEEERGKRREACLKLALPTLTSPRFRFAPWNLRRQNVPQPCPGPHPELFRRAYFCQQKT